MKYFFYVLFFFLSLNTVQAQQPDMRKKWDRIAQLKTEFVLKKLDLSSSKEDKFLPVYKDYQSELNQLFHLKRVYRDRNKDNPEKQVDDDFDLEGKILDVKRKYKKSFEHILSSEQVKTLYNSEREFKDELIKQLKDHKK